MAKQAFYTFEQWVAEAKNVLTSHPQYNDTEHSTGEGWRGHHWKALCYDTKGRLCRNGADFTRARDEGTFPIRYLWPDQIAHRLAAQDRKEHESKERLITRVLASEIPYEYVARLWGGHPPTGEEGRAGFFAVWAMLKRELAEAVIEEINGQEQTSL